MFSWTRRLLPPRPGLQPQVLYKPSPSWGRGRNPPHWNTTTQITTHHNRLLLLRTKMIMLSWALEVWKLFSRVQEPGRTIRGAPTPSTSWLVYVGVKHMQYRKEEDQSKNFAPLPPSQSIKHFELCFLANFEQILRNNYINCASKYLDKDCVHNLEFYGVYLKITVEIVNNWWKRYHCNRKYSWKTSSKSSWDRLKTFLLSKFVSIHV